MGAFNVEVETSHEQPPNSLGADVDITIEQPSEAVSSAADDSAGSLASGVRVALLAGLAYAIYVGRPV